MITLETVHPNSRDLTVTVTNTVSSSTVLLPPRVWGTFFLSYRASFHDLHISMDERLCVPGTLLLLTAFLLLLGSIRFPGVGPRQRRETGRLDSTSIQFPKCGFYLQLRHRSSCRSLYLLHQQQSS